MGSWAIHFLIWATWCMSTCIFINTTIFPKSFDIKDTSTHATLHLGLVGNSFSNLSNVIHVQMHANTSSFLRHLNLETPQYMQHYILGSWTSSLHVQATWGMSTCMITSTSFPSRLILRTPYCRHFRIKIFHLIFIDSCSHVLPYP